MQSNGCVKSHLKPFTNGYVWVSWRAGDGQVGISGHRLAWLIENGDLPKGRNPCLDHLCRNRWCQNEDHLELVTQQENMARGEYAVKTHCVNGHEYTPENTLHPDKKRPNKRTCRICNRERTAAWRRRNG